MQQNHLEKEQSVANMDSIGLEILFAARNELYMNLPYLDAALCALGFEPSGEITPSIATDGEMLYFNCDWLVQQYLRSHVSVTRAYLHVILHCMLRHLHKKRGKKSQLWDLACDAAVESILCQLDYQCLNEGPIPAKQKFIGECQRDMAVLTAEAIYHRLLMLRLEDHEISAIHRAFWVDDHELWAPENQDGQSQEQDEKWQDLAEKSQTMMETVLSDSAKGGEAVLEQVKVAVRDDIDYRAFLKRFAVPREIMAVDGDSFDYIFYSYGLQLYGNMPLVEPPETKEEKRIEDFVIAVDTSMSTTGELVRRFLACTYAILRSTETFTRKVNIRIIQCDDRIRKDTVIHELEELREYMDNFELVGGSATDFRPVFEHVAQLQKEGAFTSLRGLIYFTDGMGVYPKKRPIYDTAFVMLGEPPLSINFPPWAIKLVLEMPDLEKAAKQASEQLPEIDWDELPRT